MAQITTKDLIKAYTKDFADWVKRTKGVEFNYQELRNLALQVFWGEYIESILKQQAKEQATQAAQKVQEQLGVIDREAVKAEATMEILEGPDVDREYTVGTYEDLDAEKRS